LEEDVRSFFDLPQGRCPKPKVPRSFIARALEAR